MGIQPKGDRVLVKVLEAKNQTDSGIIIADTATEKSCEGEVIAKGLGRPTDFGVTIYPCADVGQKILYPKNVGTAIKGGDGQDLLILDNADILAVVED